MSTGSASIPLLKAAPEADQVAERLAGGPWAGLELGLIPRDVRHDAPAVRVDTLDAEARAGIARSARFAAAIGSPVLTIHLFIPQTPAELRASGGVDEPAVEAFLRCFAQECGERGVTPLIENVPPVLRMRTGGVYLTPIGGHWRDLLSWRARVPALGFTLDTSHAALFHTFAGAYPSLWGLEGEEGLELGRYVEELGPAGEVAHVSNAAGVLGEGLPYDEGELDLDPVVARIGELFPYVVAEINEADHARSPTMKAGYRSVARALPSPAGPWRRPPRRVPGERFDWQLVTPRRARARRGARRAPRSRDGRRRVHRARAHDALRGVPPGAHHGARRPRGSA